MTTSFEERQYLLYRELHGQLLTSRIAFHSFCYTAAKKIENGNFVLYTQGACKLPGWQEYVTQYAFPLNEKTKAVILRIQELEAVKGVTLLPELRQFLSYVNDWSVLHTAYEKGENPTYNWTAGRNFPYGVDECVEDVLVILAGKPKVQHLLFFI
jgi:hypothetical protein